MALVEFQAVSHDELNEFFNEANVPFFQKGKFRLLHNAGGDRSGELKHG